MKRINNYVVFEIETTGLDKEHDYVNEMVALKIKDGEMVDFKHDIFGYESIEEISNIYQDFLEDYPVIVHNYDFMKHFINFEINEVIDTLKLSKKLYPNLKNHCVNTIGKYLGCDLNKDTDLYNHTLLIHEIYKAMMDELLNKEIEAFIKNNKNITPAILQRKFIIGYHRAKKMLDNNTKHDTMDNR